jgi:hypothetical protein
VEVRPSFRVYALCPFSCFRPRVPVPQTEGIQQYTLVPEMCLPCEDGGASAEEAGDDDASAAAVSAAAAAAAAAAIAVAAEGGGAAPARVAAPPAPPSLLLTPMDAVGGSLYPQREERTRWVEGSNGISLCVWARDDFPPPPLPLLSSWTRQSKP